MFRLRNVRAQNQLQEIVDLTRNEPLSPAVTMELSERVGEEIQIQQHKLINVIREGR